MAPFPPIPSLHYSEVSLALDNDGMGFETRSGYERTSGFRPLAYQAHFYNIRTVAIAYDNAVAKDPTQVAACASLLTTLQGEIGKHGLKTGTGVPLAIPKVNPPTLSTHTTLPATALDFDTLSLPPSQLASVDRIAKSNGLFRPCRGDSVHFQLFGSGCSQGISGTALSPVNILITDPQGRRVGFDSTTGLVVNEIGFGAFYSGPGTEPQIIDIGSAIPGTYTLKGVGVATGPYTLMLERHDEDATTLSSQVTTGSIVPGQVVQTNQTVRQSVNIAILKPIELNDDGSIPVAILSSPTFVAPIMVQTSSLTFGPTGTETTPRNCITKDVNADGLPDLVCSFDQRKAGFTSSSTEGIISGTLVDETPIMGADLIRFDH
jgi:hypothetical protein